MSKLVSRVELFEQIRVAHRVEAGVSTRELARRFKVHRRTIREALASPLPTPRKQVVRTRPVMGPWTDIVDGWLTADLTAPRKQRHTGRRVWERLVDEHHAKVGERTVRAYVRGARARIGGTHVEVMVPQSHELGVEAEVDFGAVSFYLNGVLTEGKMFVMRLSASGKAFRRVYGNEAQEVFLDGHVQAFNTFGGVPHRVRYDNLKDAVAKVMLGRDRIETDRFIALRSHYRFESFYCQPGLKGAHEKGGVEGEIGRFRRRAFVPVPRVGSLVELNELLDSITVVDDRRHIASRTLMVADHFKLEVNTLALLPVEVFDTRVVLSCRVDTKSRVCVRQCFYSVPARYAGRRLDVRLGADTVEVFDNTKRVAAHGRACGKGVETLVLDHYLEVLTRKPGALLNATALKRARVNNTFTATHDAFWELARRQHGDREGTTRLINVLLLHRRHPAHVMVAAIAAALTISSTDPAVVALEARKAQQASGAVVIAIGEHLTRFDRPVPAVTHYDQLLEAQ
jgi:transposase